MQTNKAKDFFLNLGATVALYTVVGSLINLLFTVINVAFPQITNQYYNPSVSWPVAILVILFPVFILLMWILGKDYAVDPEKKNAGIHKWLTFITLFIAGIILVGDLVMVLYYFIDGQELSTAFLLKILTVLVVMGGVFGYYVSDLRGKLTTNSRMAWRVFALVIVLGSIVWGFSVLGSPRTQRLYKYDQQKITDLQNINYQVQNYYQLNASIPSTMEDLSKMQYAQIPVDPQTGNAYEYHLIGQSAKAFELCAEFNKAEDKNVNYTYPVTDISWSHPVGHYCFKLAIPVDQYRTKLAI